MVFYARLSTSIALATLRRRPGILTHSVMSRHGSRQRGTAQLWRVLPLGGAGMSAGAIGSGDCSPGSTEADRPALVSRHYWRTGRAALAGHPFVTRHESGDCDRVWMVGRRVVGGLLSRRFRKGQNMITNEVSDGLAGILRTAIVELVRRDGPDLSARQLGVFLTCYLETEAQTVRGLAAKLGSVEAGHHPCARSAVGIRPGPSQDRSVGSAQRAGAADRHRHGVPARIANDSA